MSESLIGSRISAGSNKATIRWDGEIDGKSWYGVEWDDPERGKHDGTHKGTRYFTCLNRNAGPNSGSFVNPAKVSFGQSFMEAIKSQYQSQEGDGTLGVEVFFDGGKKVEFVGEEKAARIMGSIDKLKSANLRNSDLSHAGDDDIEKQCGKIQDLDVSSTLLARWDDILKITSQLPSLTVLNMMDNRMNPLEQTSMIKQSFKNISTLVLSETGTSWEKTLSIAGQLPGLTELHACCNSIEQLSDTKIDITELPSDDQCIIQSIFPSLEVLNLQDNNLCWNEIWKVSLLPKLSKLIVSGNKITEIKIKGGYDGQNTYFKNLTSLSLSDNRIKSWMSVQELHKLKKLEKIRIARNTVTSLTGHGTHGAVSGQPAMVGSPGRTIKTSPSSEEVPKSPVDVEKKRRQSELDEERDREMSLSVMSAPARLETIARLGKLTGINGGTILSRERLDAERLYVRQCAATLLSDSSFTKGSSESMLPEPNEKFLELHPRYLELLSLHGPPAINSSDTNTANTLQNILVSLTLKCISASSEVEDVITKKFPNTMTVSSLRMICARLFQLDAGKVNVYYRDGPATPVPERMDNDFLDLAHYGIRDGGEVIVDDF